VMIHALDHVVIAVQDLDTAVTSYEKLLGRPCDGRSADGGVTYAWFQLANMALAIAARADSGPHGDWVDARLKASGDGLSALAFAVANLDKARSLTDRRGLPCGEPAPLPVLQRNTNEVRAATAAMLSVAATHGVRLSLIEQAPTKPHDAGGTSMISGLDHVVIRSPSPERAVALYGGRLGLDLRLDRSNPDWASRLLFFRCGDLVVEIVHDLKAGVSDGPDDLWGLSWRTPDLDAAHARLTAAGIAVSEIRTGRRPGTRVFTIRDKAARVPTLVIGA